MKNTTAATSRRRRRAITAGTWPWCARRPPGHAWCWGPPPPASKAATTRSELPGRIEERPMPTVELIDMRQEFLETRKQETFSRKLLDAIGERLKNGEQTIVLLNRRGFSSFVACRSCGERVECMNCSLTLTFHKRDRRLLCHYCNYA